MRQTTDSCSPAPSISLPSFNESFHIAAKSFLRFISGEGSSLLKKNLRKVCLLSEKEWLFDEIRDEALICS